LGIILIKQKKQVICLKPIFSRVRGWHRPCLKAGHVFVIFDLDLFVIAAHRALRPS